MDLNPVDGRWRRGHPAHRRGVSARQGARALGLARGARCAGSGRGGSGRVPAQECNPAELAAAVPRVRAGAGVHTLARRVGACRTRVDGQTAGAPARQGARRRRRAPGPGRRGSPGRSARGWSVQRLRRGPGRRARDRGPGAVGVRPADAAPERGRTPGPSAAAAPAGLRPPGSSPSTCAPQRATGLWVRARVCYLCVHQHLPVERAGQAAWRCATGGCRNAPRTSPVARQRQQTGSNHPSERPKEARENRDEPWICSGAYSSFPPARSPRSSPVLAT